MNIFDIYISVYNGVKDTKGATCTLRAFLTSEKHKETIIRLRPLPKKERDAIKRTLPQGCISGIFHPTRKADNIQQHTGLICVDIDKQDNPTIEDWEELKRELSKLPQVAYISLSVSGNGVFLIIPLRWPDYHKQQFEQLKRDFATMGIKIDTSCGDVSRMRCISYDPQPYMNDEAMPYEKYHVEPQPIRYYQYGTSETADRVARCVEELERTGTDITGNYETWVEVGFALSSLGEAGREFFHRVSSQNPNYKQSECDRKFNELMRDGRRTGIGTFFYLLKQYGITWK